MDFAARQRATVESLTRLDTAVDFAARQRATVERLNTFDRGGMEAEVQRRMLQIQMKTEEPESPVIVARVTGDTRAFVPMADHQRTARICDLYARALIDVAQRLNQLSAALSAENTSLDEETRPRPNGD